ncbi:unnamed protein product [Ceutorhynchus assimilis]|uniref:CRAL-TRIO domain-containing protein n=1 Tax=Ceutorhynchus assimilis TaxID=467358 RepID=A0A9N9QLH7_9CUCU|nr:unnamed protein product [Ceutorhynchus assimilis]
MFDDLLQNDNEIFFKQLEKDFHKSEKDLMEFIEIMRKWSETQKHFPEKPSDGLLRFVILYNKFSIETAKQKLDTFYTIRSLMPELFKTHPLTEDWIFQRKIYYLVPLPKVADENIRIIYQRINPDYKDAKYFNFENNLVVYLHVMQYMAENDLCYRFHFVADCSGFNLGHTAKMNPLSIRKLQILLEKVFSNRMASLHIVNAPSFMESFMNNVFLPLLNRKLRDRAQISSNTDNLFKVFGKERLPKDVGGEEKPLSELSDMLTQQYRNHEARFSELQNLTVNESLRPDKLQNDDLLGYYGSFRKLDID